MFMSGDGLVKTLLGSKSAKVERRSPTIFVKIGGEVIVAMTC